MTESTVHIGVLSLELYFAAPNSLKAKRSILKSLIDRIRSRFNVSIVEVGELDKWQKSICGVSMISGDKNYIDAGLHKVLSFVEGEKEIQVVDYQIVFM